MTLALLVLGVGALLLFAVLPFLKKIATSQLALRAAEINLLGVEQQIQNYKTALAELAKVQTKKEAVLEIFPEREGMEPLVQGLEGAVTRAQGSAELKIIDKKEDLSQSQKSPDKTAPTVAGLKNIEEIPYTLTLSGNYRVMMDFLSYLEHQQYITVLNKITITAVSEQEETSKTLRNTGLASGLFEGVFFIRTTSP